MDTTRRSIITGLIAFVTAPAIVRAGSLMPVKVMEPTWTGFEWNNYGQIYRSIWMVGERVYVSDRDGNLDVYAWGANGFGEKLDQTVIANPKQFAL